MSRSRKEELAAELRGLTLERQKLVRELHKLRASGDASAIEQVCAQILRHRISMALVASRLETTSVE